MSILRKINAIDTINNEINALFYIFYNNKLLRNNLTIDRNQDQYPS